MKVVLTAEALGDLERIDDYIALDNPGRARSFVAELLDKVSELAGLAEAFPLVPRYAERGIRRRVYGSYLIFYRVEPKQISVVHILHGARDVDEMLSMEGQPSVRQSD